MTTMTMLMATMTTMTMTITTTSTTTMLTTMSERIIGPSASGNNVAKMNQVDESTSRQAPHPARWRLQQ